ncbi:MAG: aminoacyl-tRNA hydrolase [Rhodobacterales bacterium]|jgi:PTH1 family peptidyl-tRNA hydrolase|tara:strand:+ start:5034 stop:5711 length:678 start_codon:yes stop_codon:yes gene_type:complete
MMLFVGLGNPGSQYEKNRHNVGFMAVSRIVENHNFSPWKNKFQGSISNGLLRNQKIIILKPNTFMNLSGQSVGEVIRFYKIPSSKVIVFHDEIDFPLGKLKFKSGGGHAGHNGLRSISEHIGSDYIRIRIGVGHPGNKNAVANYVLGDFSKVEQETITQILEVISTEAPDLTLENATDFGKSISEKIQKNTSKDKVIKKETVENSKRVVEDTKRSSLQKLLDRFK